MIVPADRGAITVLLLYGNVKEYDKGIIAFNTPGAANWHRSYSSSNMVDIIKTWMEAAVWYVENNSHAK